MPCLHNSQAGGRSEQLQEHGAKVSSPLVLASYFTGSPVVQVTKTRGTNSVLQQQAVEPEQLLVSVAGNRCVSMELLRPGSTMLVGAL